MDTNTNQSEEWRPVVGFEGSYEVSSLGRVRSLLLGGRILRQHPNDKGYLRVALYLNTEMKNKRVNVLVAAAFIGECPTGHEVNHKDKVKSNNEAGNLEYLTRQQNVRHSLGDGMFQRPIRKLCATDIPVIRQRLRNGESRVSVSRDYRVDQTTIKSIDVGQTWKHVL